jgi:hypothetical protein
MDTVLARYRDEQLEFLDQVLGELRDAAKEVINSVRDEEHRPRRRRKSVTRSAS